MAAQKGRPVAVSTQGLSRRYGSLWALRNVDLEVSEGELFGLLGPNGAGKTTLFSILSCQLKATRGDAIVAGHSVTRDVRRVKSLIGIVPQEAAAYDKLSAWENMILFAELYGFKGRPAHEKARQLLERVGLMGRAHDRVATFSGGMKHRLNIVLGLIHDPKIVFFDEPTTGLDPLARRDLWAIIRSLKREGRTVLLTTHYMQEAEDLCERVAILDRGRIVAIGDPNRMGDSLEEIFFRTTSEDAAAPAPQQGRRV